MPWRRPEDVFGPYPFSPSPSYPSSPSDTLFSSNSTFSSDLLDSNYSGNSSFDLNWSDLDNFTLSKGTVQSDIIIIDTQNTLIFSACNLYIKPYTFFNLVNILKFSVYSRKSQIFNYARSNI